MNAFKSYLGVFQTEPLEAKTFFSQIPLSDCMKIECDIDVD